MKKVVSGILVVVLLFSLAACGGKGGSDPIVGNWKIDTVSMNGQEVELSALAAFGLDIKSWDINCKADGTLSMSVEMFGVKEDAEGTWTLKEGTTYELASDGTPMDVTVADGKLTLEDPATGMGINFKK